MWLALLYLFGESCMKCGVITSGENQYINVNKCHNNLFLATLEVPKKSQRCI